MKLKELKHIYPVTISTVETWFGDDSERLIEEAQWCQLMESFYFKYRKPFSSIEDTETVTYYVDRDGRITFL